MCARPPAFVLFALISCTLACMFCARPAPGTDDNVDEETLPAPSQPVAECIARRYRRSAAGPHHSLPSTLPYSSSLPSALAGSALDSSPALPSSAVPPAAASPSPDASPEGTHRDTADEAEPASPEDTPPASDAKAEPAPTSPASSPHLTPRLHPQPVCFPRLQRDALTPPARRPHPPVCLPRLRRDALPPRRAALPSTRRLPCPRARRPCLPRRPSPSPARDAPARHRCCLYLPRPARWRAPRRRRRSPCTACPRAPPLSPCNSSPNGTRTGGPQDQPPGLPTPRACFEFRAPRLAPGLPLPPRRPTALLADLGPPPPPARPTPRSLAFTPPLPVPPQHARGAEVPCISPAGPQPATQGPVKAGPARPPAPRLPTLGTTTTTKALADIRRSACEATFTGLLQACGDASEPWLGIRDSPAQTSHTHQILLALTHTTLSKYLRCVAAFLDWLQSFACSLLDIAWPCLADYLHAACRSASEDRASNRLPPTTAIKALRWFARVAQISSLQAAMHAPLVGSYALPGAARDRPEAYPLPMSLVCEWERKVCRPDCPLPLLLWLGAALLCVHASLRWSDAMRVEWSSLSLTSTHLHGTCFKTKTSSHGQPFAVHVCGFTGHLPSTCWVLAWLAGLTKALQLHPQAQPDFLLPLADISKPALPWHALCPAAITTASKRCAGRPACPGTSGGTPTTSKRSFRKSPASSPCTASRAASSPRPPSCACHAKTACNRASTETQPASTAATTP